MPGGTLENSTIDDPTVFANDQVGAIGELYLDGPKVINNYRIEPGICILPIAESPPEDPTELAAWSPVAVLRLHSPYRIRTAQTKTKKNNAPPVLAAPGDTGAFVFTGGNLEFTNVLNGDQNYDWICGVEYTYVENCVSRTVDGFVLGIPGFLYPTQTENALAIGGSPSVPPFGAIAQAGQDPKIGYVQAQAGPNGYNTISYFPGLFFNDELMNGSLGPTQQQFTLTGGV